MAKLLGNRSHGLLFILSAPAGTGKTTLARMLTEEFSCVVESVSCTTRLPRPGESEGVDYHFLSKENFESRIQTGDFLEYATVFGYYYGTSQKNVEALQAQGKHVFLVIDTQGALLLQQKKLSAVYIFVSPPSLEELKERLVKRKTETESVIQERLEWARKELGMIQHYDYHIVNDNLQTAYATLRSIVIAEEHRV